MEEKVGLRVDRLHENVYTTNHKTASTSVNDTATEKVTFWYGSSPGVQGSRPFLDCDLILGPKLLVTPSHDGVHTHPLSNC